MEFLGMTECVLQRSVQAAASYKWNAFMFRAQHVTVNAYGALYGKN